MILKAGKHSGPGKYVPAASVTGENKVSLND